MFAEMFKIARINTAKGLKWFHFEATENQVQTDLFSKSGHYVFLEIFSTKMRLKNEKI